MSSSYLKRRTFHLVARATGTGKVVARTRLRLRSRDDAKHEFNSVCRSAVSLDAFVDTPKFGPIRIELYEGPSSARCNKRLLAMAGNFGEPKIVDYLGLLRPKSDMHVADTLPGLGKGVLGLDPRNAEFDGSVLMDSPIKPCRPNPIRVASDFELAAWSGALNDGVSSSRKQMMGGHIAQTPRSGPIRIMGEPEFRDGQYPVLKPEVIEELLKMSEPPHPVVPPRRTERTLNFINRQLAPFGVVFQSIDEVPTEKADLSEAIYAQYQKQNPGLDRAAFDEAYERWLSQRDALFQHAVLKDHAEQVQRLKEEGVARGDIIPERDSDGNLTGRGHTAPSMWDQLKEGNVGFKRGELALLTARHDPNGPRKSMLGINIATADKIRHNCEDPRSLQRRTMLVHDEPVMVPLFENGKQVFNEDGTPVMVIDELSMMYPTTVRLSEVVDPNLDIAATYPQNPEDRNDD